MENKEKNEKAKGSFEERVAQAKRALVGTVLGAGLAVGVGAGLMVNQNATIKAQEEIIKNQEKSLVEMDKRINKKDIVISEFLENEAIRLNMGPEIRKAVIADIQSDIQFAASIGDTKQVVSALDREIEMKNLDSKTNQDTQTGVPEHIKKKADSNKGAVLGGIYTKKDVQRWQQGVYNNQDMQRMREARKVQENYQRKVSESQKMR